MGSLLGKVILTGRYLLAVFVLGLIAALGLYALRFLWKLAKYAGEIFRLEENDALLDLLHLVDSALVASLVIMVALSSYDTLVDKLRHEAKRDGVDWIGSLDTGNLKIKLATSIVAISSIHVLQIFMKIDSFEDRQIMWSLAIHGVFLAGVLALALMDRLEGHVKAPEPKPAAQEPEPAEVI
jgi:uncharacterized protein (TIGR00645 family)